MIQLFNLSWTHWRYLLKFDNENERNYYINRCIQNNLSVRGLINEIKTKSFDRLSYADKKNIKLTYMNKKFYTDLILFNYNLNSFVIVELKLDKSKYKDIHQLLLYGDIIDKTMKKDFHNKTIAILISKENDKFILEYVSDMEVLLSSYKLNDTINNK